MLCKGAIPETSMKQFRFYYFLTVALVALALYGVPQLPHHHKHIPASRTPQALASHMLRFYDKEGSMESLCSSTAIGPHAVMTAEHCNEDDKNKVIGIDLVKERNNILASVHDGRDHVIYLLDGEPFTFYEKVIEEPSHLIDETVTIYGDGHGAFPPDAKYGKVIDCDDPSDVDNDAGQLCFSTEVIPGDSGSAVYNTHGDIVGLVTYQATDEDGLISGVGYSLDFEQDKYDTAYAFTGKLEDLPHAKE